MNIGSELFILVVLPAALAAPLDVDVVDGATPISISDSANATQPLVPLSSRAGLLDTSLLSYVNERETLAGDQIEDLADEEDELFSLLAADRRS